MKCPRCKGNNVKVEVNTYVKSKSRSFIWNLLMCFVTCGLWIIWMLVRKRKEKVVRKKIAVCQDCGKSWNA